MKFCMFIVLDETKSQNIIFKSIGQGVGMRRGPKDLLCFIIGKTLYMYTVRRVSLNEENYNEKNSRYFMKKLSWNHGRWICKDFLKSVQ